MRRLCTLIGILTSVGALLCAASMQPLPASASSSSSKPIVVGGLGDLVVGQGVVQGFKAGIYRFNKAGGLEGRKIQFNNYVDDGYSPSAALAGAQELVQNDKVMTVVPVLSSSAAGDTASYLEENKVPFIGWSINSAFALAPTAGFSINGAQTNPDVEGVVGMSQLLVALKATKNPSSVKMAFMAQDLPTGVSAENSLAGVAKYVGMRVVLKQANVPVLGVTSYAPYAQAVVESGANALYVLLSTSGAVGLSAALKAAGYRGLIVNGTTYFPGQLANQPNEAAALDGEYVENEFPTNENDTPAVKQEEKDLISTGQKPYLAQAVSVGYWSAIMFEQMLRATLARVGGNPNLVTGTALQATVNKKFVYTDPIEGGIGAIDFPAAESIPTGCGTLVRIQGDEYRQVVKYQCLGAVNIATKKKYNEKTGQQVG